MLDKLVVGLVLSGKVERLFRDRLKAKNRSPHPRILWLSMGDELTVALEADMIKDEPGAVLEDPRAAILLAKTGPFHLGEIAEPTDPRRADRFILIVSDDMCRLIVIAIIGLPGGDAMFLDEANTSDRKSVQELLICCNDVDVYVIKRCDILWHVASLQEGYLLGDTRHYELDTRSNCEISNRQNCDLE